MSTGYNIRITGVNNDSNLVLNSENANIDSNPSSKPDLSGVIILEDNTLRNCLANKKLKCATYPFNIPNIDEVLEGKEGKYLSDRDGYYVQLLKGFEHLLFGETNVIEMVPTSAATRLSGLYDGSLDIGLRGTTKTVRRMIENNVDFGRTYYHDGQVFTVNTDNIDFNYLNVNYDASNLPTADILVKYLHSLNGAVDEKQKMCLCDTNSTTYDNFVAFAGNLGINETDVLKFTTLKDSGSECNTAVSEGENIATLQDGLAFQIFSQKYNLKKINTSDGKTLSEEPLSFYTRANDRSILLLFNYYFDILTNAAKHEVKKSSAISDIDNLSVQLKQYYTNNQVLKHFNIPTGRPAEVINTFGNLEEIYKKYIVDNNLDNWDGFNNLAQNNGMFLADPNGMPLV